MAQEMDLPISGSKPVLVSELKQRKEKCQFPDFERFVTANGYGQVEHIARDHNCLFHCLSRYAGGNHVSVRKAITQQLRDHFDKYHPYVDAEFAAARVTRSWRKKAPGDENDDGNTKENYECFVRSHGQVSCCDDTCSFLSVHALMTDLHPEGQASGMLCHTVSCRRPVQHSHTSLATRRRTCHDRLPRGQAHAEISLPFRVVHGSWSGPL